MKLFKTILLLSFLFTSSLIADFKSLSTSEVEDAIKKDVPIIDIRRMDEYKYYGVIKGSHLLTFFDDKGSYDIAKWMEKFTKIVKSKDQEFILVCAHSNRTKVVAKFLDQQLKYKKVRDLEGGIIYGWIDKGKKTVKIK